MRNKIICICICICIKGLEYTGYGNGQWVGYLKTINICPVFYDICDPGDHLLWYELFVMAGTLIGKVGTHVCSSM